VLPAAAFPEGGPYKGRDQIDRFFAGLSEGWDSLSVVIRETQAVGDHVFVLFEWRAIGEASHIEVASQWFAVYTIRAGQIVRLQFFDDREAARGAVGLA
jgi:ketosteroid isomerase-like protein